MENSKTKCKGEKLGTLLKRFRTHEAPTKGIRRQIETWT